MKKTTLLVCASVMLLGCQDTQESSPAEPGDVASEPELKNSYETLEAELRCTDFVNVDKPPILLVHGTFTAGWEQYEWSYIPVLSDLGYDVCTTTYPNRGLGDLQNSAEYVVHALRRIHEMTGRKVAVIGHSQGVAVPRWAIKWWASARQAVDDFVMIAGPNKGTDVADPLAMLGRLLGVELPLTGGDLSLPASFHQMAYGSQFMRATNLHDETPGDISYTAVYTMFDELVQPYAPEPVAAVDYTQGNPNVTNLLLQDLCPGYVMEHVLIGLADAVTFNLALDAINHPGPADVERAGGAALCGLPLLPELSISVPGMIAGGAAIPAMEFDNGLPSGLHLSAGEPALRDYAQAALDEAEDGS